MVGRKIEAPNLRAEGGTRRDSKFVCCTVLNFLQNHFTYPSRQNLTAGPSSL